MEKEIIQAIKYAICFNSYEYSSKEDRQGLNDNLIESLKQNRDWEE